MGVTLKSLLLIKLILLASLVSVLTSGPARSEKTDAKSVLILLGEHDLNSCRLLGKVTGTSEGVDDDVSYPDRMIVARDGLRNETLKLGGNAVHVKYTHDTARFEAPGIEKKIVFAGDAYYCE